MGIQFLWGIISIKLNFIYKILFKLGKTQLFWYNLIIKNFLKGGDLHEKQHDYICIKRW